MSIVAANTPFSPSAAKRHIRIHLNAQQQIVMRTMEAATLHVHDLAARSLALADEASLIRASTLDPRTKLLAIREEQSVLSALTLRLGIDSRETVETLQEARALAIALSTVLADEPRVTAALSRELSVHREHDLARAFLRLAADASARHVAQAAGQRQLREVGA